MLRASCLLLLLVGLGWLLLVGMAIQGWKPALAERFESPLDRVANGLFLLLMALMVATPYVRDLPGVTVTVLTDGVVTVGMEARAD